MKKQNNEYQLCKQVATYLRLQYPTVLFHFDLTGLNLSKAQAGMNKAIQHSKGWPDLFIAKHKFISNDSDSIHGGNIILGLFIELKAEGVDLFKKRPNIDGRYDYASPHIEEQSLMIEKLNKMGYKAEFAVGFDEAKILIDNYLK